MASSSDLRPEPPTDDPSRFSWYVDDDFYARVVDDAAAWQEPGVAVDDPRQWQEAHDLLLREAWYLDEGWLHEWLELFSPRCLYWVPATPGGGDPRREVSIAFDDRRRLEDRVHWLNTGFVWSQLPPSRARRQITNVEVLRGRSDHELRVRSNFAIFEIRPGSQRILPGWYGHLLERTDEGLRIRVKQVNLLDSDQAHRNMTIVL